MMEGLDRMGLISAIGVQVSNLIMTVPAGGSARLAAAVTIIVWVSGLASAFIDNIPFTTGRGLKSGVLCAALTPCTRIAAMIPVVLALASPPLELPLGPLVWALAFGACLGGNGTIVGASANVVAAGLAEAAGHPISFMHFFRRGFPVAMASLAVANVYLLLFHGQRARLSASFSSCCSHARSGDSVVLKEHIDEAIVRCFRGAKSTKRKSAVVENGRSAHALAMTEAPSMNLDAKVVLLGDSAVGGGPRIVDACAHALLRVLVHLAGKTSIALRYVQDIFSSSSNPTIGASFLTKRV